MTEFSTWLQDMVRKYRRGTWREEHLALAELAAQQHEALDEVNCKKVAASNFQDAKCLFDGPGGLPRGEWCKPCIAEYSADNFKAEYDAN